MLATSKNVLLPGFNHLLTIGADDSTLRLSPERQVEVEVASMVVTWWIVGFFCQVESTQSSPMV